MGLLDLILTNEENMVSYIVHESPLGSSDHEVITFTYQCYFKLQAVRNSKINFAKGDYEKLTEKLDVNWHEKFSATDTTEEMLETFHYVRSLAFLILNYVITEVFITQP